MSNAKIPATTSSIIIPVPDLISSIPFTGPNFKMSNIQLEESKVVEQAVELSDLAKFNL